MRLALFFLVVVALSGCSKSEDSGIYSDLSGYPLWRILNEAEFIGVGRLSATDPKNFKTGIHIVRSLKGRTPLLDWSLDILGITPHKVLARHLVDGSPVVVFTGSQVLVIYVNRMFILSYGDPAVGNWANCTFQGRMNETFNGTALELAQVCDKALKGELKPPDLCSSLPPIDAESIRKLPAWNEDVSDAKLPPPFRRSRQRAVVPLQPEKPESIVAGLEVARFKGDAFSKNDTPLEVGVAPLPDSRHAHEHVNEGLRFRGFLEVPRDGDYAFTSDVESSAHFELMIGSTEVSTTGPLPEFVPLLAGKHAVTVKYTGPGGPDHLKLYWSGPDLPKERIPAKSWTHYP